jgi:hypothetical protein
VEERAAARLLRAIDATFRLCQWFMPMCGVLRRKGRAWSASAIAGMKR